MTIFVDGDRAAASSARRRTLRLLGASGIVLVAGRALTVAAAAADDRPPACVVRPRQTEGPFYVAGDVERSDLRLDSSTGEEVPGVPLRLSFRVSRLTPAGCAPVSGVQVHVWSCDATGRYSAVHGPHASTAGDAILRGYQTTDAGGAVRFLTIYPGWYPGRAVHVHFKILTASAESPREFTSQLYFDDALSDAVYRSAPYARRYQREM
ncbi:MAG TPA: twin-arginine translocation pathway signal protein, partial [Casimicrobiaceae bacterium]|nr:twin-arginine translocation pathway signal protein [Casimicrobiaceae bacterium]